MDRRSVQFCPVAPELRKQIDSSDGYNKASLTKPSPIIPEVKEFISSLDPDYLSDLSRQIEEFNAIHPQPNEFLEAKEELRQEIEQICTQISPGSKLIFCGSTRNGCGFGNSDVDLCWAIEHKVLYSGDCRYPTDVPVTDTGFFPVMLLYKLNGMIGDIDQKYLQGTVINREPVMETRVKILKFSIRRDVIVNKETGEKKQVIFDVDVNINNLTGIFNTLMLHHFSRCDPRVVQLSRLAKHWGSSIGIVNPKEGFLNSYCMTLLVIHFLQCGIDPPILPNLIAIAPDILDGNLELSELNSAYEKQVETGYTDTNPASIGELFAGFVKYYSIFDYANDRMSITEGAVVRKKGGAAFQIAEVYDGGLTVARNVKAEWEVDKGKKSISRLTYIVSCFQDACFSLMNRASLVDNILNKDCRSILVAKKSADEIFGINGVFHFTQDDLDENYDENTTTTISESVDE